jgi:hypothetical protein
MLGGPLNSAETLLIISQATGANYMPQICKQSSHPFLVILSSPCVLLEEIMKV